MIESWNIAQAAEHRKRPTFPQLRHAAEKVAAYARGEKWIEPRRYKRVRQTRLATPAWADRKAIKAIYTRAKAITRDTGIKHVVDHFVPLIAKRVCGLHVEGNLSIITKYENARKSNRWPLE